MSTCIEHTAREALQDRRRRLAATIAEVGGGEDLVLLLGEVDAALARVDAPDFGICAVCGEPVEDELLVEHPATTYCLCDLDAAQMEALQHDLGMAWRLQSALLPPQDRAAGGWQVHYRYLPAGPVSGDYCDVLEHPSESSSLYFFVGDVSGKGVAASLLMSHLNALLRSQVRRGTPVAELLREANAHLNGSIPSTHFATLVAARGDADGRVELSNAGHCRPLVVRAGGVERLVASGFPLGVVEDATYDVQTTRLEPGETLVLYSDGVIDAGSIANERFGQERLETTLGRAGNASPGHLAQSCLAEIAAFASGAARVDDITLMVIRRLGDTAGGA